MEGSGSSVFASGDERVGLWFSRIGRIFPNQSAGPLTAQIIGVISNQSNMAEFVEERTQLHIPFEYWSGPFDAKGYRAFVEKYQADFVMCSGG